MWHAYCAQWTMWRQPTACSAVCFYSRRPRPLDLRQSFCCISPLDWFAFEPIEGQHRFLLCRRQEMNGTVGIAKCHICSSRRNCDGTNVRRGIELKALFSTMADGEKPNWSNLVELVRGWISRVDNLYESLAGGDGQCRGTVREPRNKRRACGEGDWRECLEVSQVVDLDKWVGERPTLSDEGWYA